jgi:hypothetical protein
MGYSGPVGNEEGLIFPYLLAPGTLPGATQLNSVNAATEFNPLELYKLGLIPKDQVPPILQFSDQTRARAWLFSPYALPSCGSGCQVLDVPSSYVTIDDVIASDGPTPPATKTSYSLHVVVLSAGRLLTPNEMAFFNYQAARGEGTVPTKVWEGFAVYQGEPLYSATGGRLSLTTRVQ